MSWIGGPYADDHGLIAAARFERERRLQRAPAKLAELEEGARPCAFGVDGAASQKRETILIDCQCWVAIAEWVETGLFMGFYGGADPASDAAQWISWPALEAAAASAVAGVSRRIERLEADPSAAPETLGGLRMRRWALAVIHRRIALRRESIDLINAEFRRRENGKGVAA